jgi:hypothetical protein
LGVQIYMCTPNVHHRAGKCATDGENEERRAGHAVIRGQHMHELAWLHIYAIIRTSDRHTVNYTQIFKYVARPYKSQAPYG